MILVVIFVIDVKEGRNFIFKIDLIYVWWGF